MSDFLKSYIDKICVVDQEANDWKIAPKFFAGFCKYTVIVVPGRNHHHTHLYEQISLTSFVSTSVLASTTSGQL